MIPRPWRQEFAEKYEKELYKSESRKQALV
jgi:hypothetical protein